MEKLEGINNKKLEIAKTLFENANAENTRLAAKGLGLGNGQECGYLKQYFTNLEAIQNDDVYLAKDDIDDMKERIDTLKELDKCIELIIVEEFDYTDWLLFEMPIEGVFCFVHISREYCFDINISEGKAIPGFIDDSHKPHDATTIKEAIDNYYLI